MFFISFANPSLLLSCTWSALEVKSLKWFKLRYWNLLDIFLVTLLPHTLFGRGF